MNKDLKDRQVPCIRTGKGAKINGEDAQEGQKVAFSSGSTYEFHDNGSWTRVGKNRRLSKSERKKLKRERTLARVASQQ